MTLLFKVRDTGIGIPEDKQSIILRLSLRPTAPPPVAMEVVVLAWLLSPNSFSSLVVASG